MKDKQVWVIYLSIALGGIFCFFILLLKDGVKAAEWLVMERNFNYQFTDHFRHLILVQDMRGLYRFPTDATLPPLAYLFYRVLLYMDPTEYPMELSSCFLMEFQEYQLLIFVMYLCLVTVVLFLAMKKLICWSYSDTSFLALAFSVLLSAAMVSGAYERGNIALLTLVLLVLALYFKESESKIKRETALVLISIAAGLKMYPAFMGLLYIKEKRWKEALRLMIYGILCFFVPFVFMGGVSALQMYIQVLKTTVEDPVLRFTNIGSYVPGVIVLFGGNEELGKLLGQALEGLLLGICLLAFWRTKENWKRVLYISMLMVLFVPKSYRYVAIYTLLPFLCWGREKRKRGDIVYAIIFGFIFSIPFYGYFLPQFSVHNPDGSSYILPIADLYIFLPIYVLLVWSVIQSIYREKREKRE